MGLVLDEQARERLAEGRRLLRVIVSEHGRLRQAAFEEGWGLGSHATSDRRMLQGLGKALAEGSARSMPAATMPAS
jgi:hypothetical protein